jgi:hypothetical protein
LAELLQAVHGDAEAMDALAPVNAGITCLSSFLSPQSVERISGAAA